MAVSGAKFSTAIPFSFVYGGKTFRTTPAVMEIFRGFFERNAGYLLNSFSVDGIAECQEADGYVYAFDRDKPKSWERRHWPQIRSRLSRIQKP